MWRFPDRTTEIGTMINAYLGRSKELDDAAVHLLFSANRWEKRAELLRQLSRGTTLVCDRYAFSGVAFTAAKKKTGMGLEWCRSPDEGLPAPDAVLFLDLDPAEAERRGGFGEERYESPEMLKAVREAFAEIASFVDGRCTRWLRVDASGSVEEVGERVGAAAARGPGASSASWRRRSTRSGPRARWQTPGRRRRRARRGPWPPRRRCSARAQTGFASPSAASS